MPKKINIRLSDADIEAILTALRIIPYADFDTPPAQMDLNCFLAETSAQKLIAKKVNMSPNETRIVGASVILARDILSGLSDLEVPTSLKKDLQPYFFNYNRLAPRYEAIERLYLGDLDSEM